MSSVLYDIPGPKAKRRNLLFSVVFLVLLGLLAWWAIDLMGDKDQWVWAKWKPFITAEPWTTYLLPALANTLKAAGLSMVIALPLGALLGIARLSDHRWVRIPVGAVVEFFRAIPVLIMMVFASAFYVQSTDISSDDRPMYAVITGLVLYNASVLAEIVRAGILSLPKGQTEAAKAIGLRKGQTMRTILLPQAVTAMLPAIVSQLVVILKDTALGGAVLNFTELLNSRGTIAGYYGNPIQTFAVIAVIYVLLNFTLTTFASWLEKRLRRGKRSTGAVLGAGAVEDVAGAGAGTAGIPAAKVRGSFSDGSGGTV
ncbi:amino acid ABC transporter permease [Streptomyces indicus]|uniref:Glutamate transport system permease protein n=1 Tax=Streptomyces indicus TaxID=417292 RepID=A0A1G9B170_9ACTN|nr:amino acid ABC transporter permease [Streptomyces indicus]SDK33277.1 glutamate transport system permease protein [Streptomyces indicus]